MYMATNQETKNYVWNEKKKRSELNVVKIAIIPN